MPTIVQSMRLARLSEAKTGSIIAFKVYKVCKQRPLVKKCDC